MGLGDDNLGRPRLGMSVGVGGRLLRSLIVATLFLVLTPAMPARAQPARTQPAATQQAASTGVAPDPLAEPVVRAPAVLEANRAVAWQQGGARWLLLDEQVRFEMGAYGFTGRRALVRLDTEQRPGQRIKHLSLYIDQAEPLYGKGPVRAEAPRLLVTGSTSGGVTLETSVLERSEGPPRAAMVQAGLGRINAHRRAIRQAHILPVPDQPLIDEQPFALKRRRRAAIDAAQRSDAVAFRREAERQAARAGQPGAPGGRGAATQPGRPRAAPRPRRPSGVLPSQGVVNFSFDRIVVKQTGAGRTAAMLMGGVRIMYQHYRGAGRDVVLKAERAVLMLGEEGADQPTGRLAGQTLDAGAVRGVYLESNAVVTDGEYTVRAPRIYYDLARNKAILLEAVVYSYDVRRDVPLYMRADVLKQNAARSFEARDATLTTSSFAEPHVAIRADRLTVEQQPRPGGEKVNAFAAEDTTLEVGGTPVFYWPYFAGQGMDPPLKSLAAGYDSDYGPEVETTWDLLALLGQPNPEDTELLFEADYRGEHGVATGVDADYQGDDLFGRLDTYLLPRDDGVDEIGGRQDVPQDGGIRGFGRWQHRQALNRQWELSLEAGYISDPTFLEEFEEHMAEEGKPFETSAYLKNQQGEAAFTLLGKTQTNDFTAQLAQLQTPGYNVEKLPEAGYFRTGSSLWDGRLTWFSENRLGRVRARFGSDSPADRGFPQFTSQALFGIDRDTSFEQAARAHNFPTDWVTRFDTRQELAAPTKAGMFDITPYLAGRVTAYDQDFSQFNGGEEDQIRLRGTVGTRVSTQFHNTWGDVENDLLALHGLRHLIEPSVDLSWAESTLASEDLPVYDYSVESLAEGGTVRFGLENTLQTHRGGPGRWRAEDWISLQTDLVLRSEDGPRDGLLPRMFAYRPGYSVGGSHFYTELLWMVSDSLGVTAELTHDFEAGRIAQWRVGARLDHTPRLRTYVWYNEIDPLQSKLLTYGLNYQLTTKYRVGLRQTLDFGQSESRLIAASLQRRLPQWRLTLVGSVDQLSQEKTIGFRLTPEGVRRSFGGGTAMFRRGHR